MLGASSPLTPHGVPASSPYNLVSEVQVAPGVTLTIEPGVVVKGNGRTIRVFGTLNAVGSDSSRIAFSDTKIAPGSGTAGGSQYLIRIEFAVIDGGSVYEATGYAIYGSLRLTDSVIRNLTQPMYIWYPTADCFLEKNIFYQSKGISIGIQSPVRIYIRYNAFYAQTGNLHVDSAIENWAAYGGASGVVVAYNSFLSTDRVALALPINYSSVGMTAQDNYWNTADTSIIDSMIFDRKDDLRSADYINYSPYGMCQAA